MTKSILLYGATGFIFLVMVLGYFLVDAAGRALGADAWLRRHVASVRDGRGFGAVLRLFT